jgi:hypothetical protein
VQHVAAEFPQFCEAETEAFSRLLGVHVQRLATLAHGDHVCTTFVPNPDHLHPDQREGLVMTSHIEDLNPGLKGLGTYEYGWADADTAGDGPPRPQRGGRRATSRRARTSRSGCSTCG